MIKKKKTHTKKPKPTKQQQKKTHPPKSLTDLLHQDQFNFLLCNLHDGLAFCWWEIIPRSSVSPLGMFSTLEMLLF